ncbi:transcription elongation factor GreA [Myxococcota bacterium]|nr:transcription elongation factor GreA [Myxococcota bacterium]MBU1432312.1 transcription elongation factor GreA [Myxococcota bacterium]
MERYPITEKGYRRLMEELKRMKTLDRRAVAQELEIARAHGDLRENADYDAAKEKQGMLEATIRDYEDRAARAHVVDVSRLSGDRVIFGATVTLIDTDTEEERTLTIVGEFEADPKQGLISVRSPIAAGLIGKEVDDVVTIRTPGGEREYEIVGVTFNG